jgi:integrase
MHAFENYLIKKGRQQATIEGHLKKLRVLERELPKWDLESVDQFIVNLKKAGRSNATINCYIDCIRIYSQMMGYDPLLCNYQHFKKKFRIKGTMSDDEVEALYSIPCPKGRDEVIWQKDSLFLKVIALTGARPGEIAKLTRYDLTDRYIQINESKTGKPRLIPIAEPLRKDLEQYLYKLIGDELFITHKGCVYSDHSWLPMFKKRMKMLGINRPNVTLYSLRHSMVTSLLRQKIPAQTISKLCGNSVDMITNVYSHMIIEDVEEALTQHPLIRKTSDPKEIIRALKQTIEKLHLEKDPRFEFILKEEGSKLEITVGVKV